MDWVHESSQLHNTFSHLGYLQGDGYQVDESCNAALKSILNNILKEDKCIRNYRRSIGFGQNVNKDLIPLFIHAKEDETLGLLTLIFDNLTTPTECLIPIGSMSTTNHGQHTIFELDNLLVSIKKAFSEPRVTRVVVEFIKKNLESEKKAKLLPQQCENIKKSLSMLRNILHIPEDSGFDLQNYTGSFHPVQNQIVWNIFSQSIDKTLMELMSVPDACYWGVPLVQFVALLYKDQQGLSLQKTLTVWLASSLSESSEDNESNTSPFSPGSQFSPSTSEPASDSSDTDSRGKSNDDSNNTLNDDWKANQHVLRNMPTKQNNDSNMENLDVLTGNSINNDSNKCDKNTSTSCMIGRQSKQRDPIPSNCHNKIGIFRNCNSGYEKCIDNQESVSTSSSDEDMPPTKPMHHKMLKQRPNIKVHTEISLQEHKRKKVMKRGKSAIINVRGLTHNAPSDEEIANVLKEFTVDFLLKGYNSMVQMLHNEILTNSKLEIDTSHFFWLLTYFLNFTGLLEIEFEQVDSVVSYGIVSFITAEGALLCEQFEHSIKLDPSSLVTSSKRLHLLVTAIRELVQTIDSYKKHVYLKDNDREALVKLQIKMCETEEFRSLLVLLLRNYNPNYHSKQYLKDIVITNHILLLFLDNIMKYPEYKCSASMGDHLKQFASSDIMYKYGTLLEDIHTNGEFLNECIFTVLYHVGGALDGIKALYQTNIMKTFATLKKTDLNLSQGKWDLIEYAINSFLRKHKHLRRGSVSQPQFGSIDDERERALYYVYGGPRSQIQELYEMEHKERAHEHDARKGNALNERWTADEISSLCWIYMQCNTSSDVIGEIIEMLKDDDINKSRNAVVMQLYNQRLIKKEEFEKFMEEEKDRNSNPEEQGTKLQDLEVAKLIEQLAQDGFSKALVWVQKVLLDTCYAKIYVEKRKMDAIAMRDSKLMEFELFRKSAAHLSVVSPVSYHSLILNKPVPLVIWNCEQARFCDNLKFLQLMNKLGFNMPLDSGKVFIRIPESWTTDFMYGIAGKLGPIDTSKLKFSVNESAKTSAAKPGQEGFMYSEMTSQDKMTDLDEYYQLHKQNEFAPMTNFTPMPGRYYQPEDRETDTNNWFKVVQKSHELNMTSQWKNEMSAIVTKMTSDITASAPSRAAAPAPAPLTTRAAEPTSTVGLPLFQNDMCKTTSVVSDVKGMYVSDSDSDAPMSSEADSASDSDDGDGVRSRSPLRRAAASPARPRARDRARARARERFLAVLNARPRFRACRSAPLSRKSSD